jgi:hypothetical protein
MNYTFLPYIGQKNIKREYHLRVVIVFMFFFSIALVVGVGSLFPAYIYATVEERLHLDQVAAFKRNIDSSAFASTQEQLSTSAHLLTALDPYVTPSPFYSTVDTIVGMKGSIQLTSIAIDYSKTGQINVSLSGIAPTRDSLLSFKDRLSNISPKTQVNLPISALTKDTDITFSLQVIEALK